MLAQQALTQAENNLKLLMLPNRADLMWRAALIPETQFDPNVPLPDFDEAVRQALQSRPELAEAALALDINHADQRLAKEGTLPARGRLCQSFERRSGWHCGALDRLDSGVVLSQRSRGAGDSDRRLRPVVEQRGQR